MAGQSLPATTGQIVMATDKPPARGVAGAAGGRDDRGRPGRMAQPHADWPDGTVGGDDGGQVDGTCWRRSGLRPPVTAQLTSNGPPRTKAVRVRAFDAVV